MGYLESGSTLTIETRLTHRGRGLFLSGRLGGSRQLFFTLGDGDTDYRLASTNNTPRPGAVPDWGGSGDPCLPAASHGVNNYGFASVLTNIPAYEETATYTATCAEGRDGTPVTTSRSATGSTRQEAYDRALGLARQASESALVCGWVSVRTATATCGPGTSGSPVTATVRHVSPLSQADADAVADRLAQQRAAAGLACTAVNTVPVFAPTADYRCKGSNNPLGGTPSTLNTGIVQRRYANTNPNATAPDQWRDEYTNAVACPLPMPIAQITYRNFRRSGSFTLQDAWLTVTGDSGPHQGSLTVALRKTKAMDNGTSTVSDRTVRYTGVELIVEAGIVLQPVSTFTPPATVSETYQVLPGSGYII